MKFTTAIIFLPLFATGASADTPGRFSPNLSAASVHTLSIAEQELEAQQKLNREYRQHLRDTIIDAGGCDADWLPFEVAASCGWVAFGAPVFGSQGD